jgi:hypothetical protein
MATRTFKVQQLIEWNVHDPETWAEDDRFL